MRSIRKARDTYPKVGTSIPSKEHLSRKDTNCKGYYLFEGIPRGVSFRGTKLFILPWKKLAFLRYKVQGLVFLGYRVQGTRYRVEGTGYRVQGTGVSFSGVLQSAKCKVFSLLLKQKRNTKYRIKKGCLIFFSEKKLSTFHWLCVVFFQKETQRDIPSTFFSHENIRTNKGYHDCAKRNNCCWNFASLLFFICKEGILIKNKWKQPWLREAQ